MNLIQAINNVVQGQIVVSCSGQKYTYDMLQPKWFGEYYASYQTCEMTELEKKGEWEVG